MTDKPPRVVNCPSCGSPVQWVPANRYRPFCSERCKLVDLGQWATEQYRVAHESPADSNERPDVDSR